MYSSVDKKGNCVVCLSTKTDTSARIDFQSSEWYECNIQRVIEKHLWWWHLKIDSSTNFAWVCRQCWQELSSFHIFYNQVERIHQQYYVLNGPDLKDSVVTRDCYVDAINSNRQTISEGIQNDNLNITSNVEVNEPPVLIKFENVTFNAETLQEKFEVESVDEIPRSEDKTFTSHIKTDRQKKDSENFKIPPDVKTKKRKRKLIETSNNFPPARLEKMKKNDDYIAQSGYKLVCDLCCIPLNDFSILRMHFRQDHQIPAYVMCCNRKFSTRGPLVDHLKLHQDPNYFKCKICDRVLNQRLSYKNHLKSHKSPSEQRERVFNCNECDKSFFTKAIYNRHVLCHVPDNERKFQCDQCDRKFAAEYLVSQHKAFAHLSKYWKICDICGKSFRERFSFMRHLEEHNGAKPTKVSCDICGAKLVSKYLLNRHIKYMHTEENQEQTCPYCSKVSVNMHSLRRHIFYVHKMVRKHACHMCEKKFKNKRELREHLSTHTGEVLYTCAHCPRTFISNANWLKHRKTAHPNEWQEEKLAYLRLKNKVSVTH